MLTAPQKRRWKPHVPSRGDNFKWAGYASLLISHCNLRLSPVSRHAAAVHGGKLQHELRMSIYLHPALVENNRYAKPYVQSMCKQHH